MPALRVIGPCRLLSSPLSESVPVPFLVSPPTTWLAPDANKPLIFVTPIPVTLTPPAPPPAVPITVFGPITSDVAANGLLFVIVRLLPLGNSKLPVDTLAKFTTCAPELPPALLLMAVTPESVWLAEEVRL